MRQAWPDIEKQEILWDELNQFLTCGPRSLTNWCHAQVSLDTFECRLHEGICFLRSSVSWSCEEDATVIEIPAFHAGPSRFRQVGLVIATVDGRNDDLTTARLHVIEDFEAKIMRALKRDILDMRLAFS